MSLLHPPLPGAIILCEEHDTDKFIAYVVPVNRNVWQNLLDHESMLIGPSKSMYDTLKPQQENLQWGLLPSQEDYYYVVVRNEDEVKMVAELAAGFSWEKKNIFRPGDHVDWEFYKDDSDELHAKLARLKEQIGAVKEQMYDVKDDEIVVDPKKHREFVKLYNQLIQLMRTVPDATKRAKHLT